MNSKFNMPPGVTMRDVDPPMVKCGDCVDGMVRSGDINDDLTDMLLVCQRCGGSGEIPKEDADSE